MVEGGLDPNTGMGLVTVKGALAPDEREECLRAMRQLADRTRARFGAARVILDGNEAAVQPREIASAVDMSSILSADDDRIAVVVGSALLAMQARRVMVDPRVTVFPDRADAVAWLTSPNPSAGAPS